MKTTGERKKQKESQNKKRGDRKIIVKDGGLNNFALSLG